MCVTVCVCVTAVQSEGLFAPFVSMCVYVFSVESEGSRFRSPAAKRPNSKDQMKSRGSVTDKGKRRWEKERQDHKGGEQASRRLDVLE